MIGSIIGDIVGSIYEFNNIKTKDFPLFTNEKEFTDDSVLCIATAQWILDCCKKALRSTMLILHLVTNTSWVVMERDFKIGLSKQSDKTYTLHTIPAVMVLPCALHLLDGLSTQKKR